MMGPENLYSIVSAYSHHCLIEHLIFISPYSGSYLRHLHHQCRHMKKRGPPALQARSHHFQRAGRKEHLL
jgi:hypothetical protein